MDDATKRDDAATVPPAAPPAAAPRRRLWQSAGFFFTVLVLVAGISVAVTALLVNIFERKQEAKNPYLRVVEVTEATVDPAVWGQNWPSEYNSYQRTVDH
ncbi:MAG TPA: hypothetical protein VF796_19910, partial [Humisphaera sp.]